VHEAVVQHTNVASQPYEDRSAAARWAWACIEELASVYCEGFCGGCALKDSSGDETQRLAWTKAQHDLHEAIAYLPKEEGASCTACAIADALKQFPIIAKHSPVPPVGKLLLNTIDAWPELAYCGGWESRLSFPCCNAVVSVGEGPPPDDKFGVRADALRNLDLHDLPPMPPPAYLQLKQKFLPGQQACKAIYALAGEIDPSGGSVDDVQPLDNVEDTPQNDFDNDDLLGKNEELIVLARAMSNEEIIVCLRTQLFLYAQAYYHLLRSVVGNPGHIDDVQLNDMYLRVISAINNLLKMPLLQGFPGGFEAIFEHIMFSDDLDFAEWDEIAGSISDFLSRTQSYMHEAQDVLGLRYELIKKYLIRHEDRVKEIAAYATAHKKRIMSAYQSFEEKVKKNKQSSSEDISVQSESNPQAHSTTSVKNKHEAAEALPKLSNDEFWDILGWQPPALQRDTFLSRPVQPCKESGIPSSAWIDWAKNVIQSMRGARLSFMSDTLVAYLCSLMYILDVLKKESPHVNKYVGDDHLRAMVMSGLAASGLDIQDISPYFDNTLSLAKQRGFVVTEDVDEWRPGMASGSGWKTYFRLTVAGRLLAAKNGTPMLDLYSSDAPEGGSNEQSEASRFPTTPSSQKNASQREDMKGKPPWAANSNRKEQETLESDNPSSTDGDSVPWPGFISVDEKDRLVVNRQAFIQHVLINPKQKGKKDSPKRSARAAAIDAIRSALREHLRVARDHAFDTKQRTCVPELLPRPTQKDLAKQLKLSPTAVSRALSDESATELQIMWKGLLDIECVMRRR